MTPPPWAVDIAIMVISVGVGVVFGLLLKYGRD